MPPVKDFGGFRIVMYFEDHNPPHVHVVSPSFEGLISIRDGVVFRGSIPARARQRALAWIEENRAMLLTLWDELQQRASAMEETVRVKAVAAGKKPFSLVVVWSDGSKSAVDLTGLIHRSRHFRVFIDDPAAFRKVAVANFGSGIGWANGLDYAADTLRVLATEQRPLSGEDLVAFQSRHDLNTAETANLLRVAERTVRAYRTATELPAPVAIALRRMDSNPTVLAAHYRPVGQRKRGRPKAEAAG